MTNAANHHMEIEYDGDDAFIELTCLHDESEDGCSLVEGLSAVGSEYFLNGSFENNGPRYESGDIYLWWEYEGTDWESGYPDYTLAWEYAPKENEQAAPDRDTPDRNK